MSASDMKRSKRRRNKRGGGGVSGKPSRQQKQAGIGDQILTAAKVSATFSELDLDNIPQPLTKLPMRANNPYLQQDGEHCLLCRRERPDLPAQKIPPVTEHAKDSNQSVITQVPLWLCPDCRRTVEEDERNATRNSQPPLLPQEFLLQPSLSPLLNKLDGTFNVPAGLLGTAAVKGSEATCSCEPCRERREIAAEQELVQQQLAESWSELSHVVRCVYCEAGTALAENEDSSKLSLPRMKELLHRLCTHDPHQLFLQLELEVDDYVKEISGRLSRQLAIGYKSLHLAKQFVSMLLEEYDDLCSAAKTLSAVLDELEKEHLTKFQLTWLRHNMHMFHSTVYVTLGLREKFTCLINELRQGTGSKEACLLHRYLKFDEAMSVISVEWRDSEQLINKYHEEQMSQDCLKTKQQTLGADWEFLKTQKIFPDHTGLKTHMGHAGKEAANSVKSTASDVLGRLLNGSETEHKGSTCKKRCPCDECSIARLTSSLLTPDLYEEYGLKNLDGANPAQLSALDTYLQSINPPDLSSSSSSLECSYECSSDSDGVPPIFSRGDLTQSGFSSPRSEESEDSDDLESETSPSPTHNAGTEEESKDKPERRVNGDGSSLSKKTSRDGNLKESGNRSCSCGACTDSHKVLSSTFGTGYVADKLDLTSQPQSYLFYPNLPNHQPLDLSHHGITAKHPFIHPHLYNLTSQKMTKVTTCPTQQLPQQQQQQQQQPLLQQTSFQLNVDSQDSQRDHLGNAYGDWKRGAIESAKMMLNSRGCSGNNTDPDLLQSVRAALHQSNCKAAAERAPSLNMSAPEQPCKQHAGKLQKEAGASKKKANHVCAEATTNGTSAATTAKEQVAQHHHHHHSSQSSSSSTDSAKKSRSDSSGADRCAKHSLAASKTPSTTSAIMQAYQQQCSQLGHAGIMSNGMHGGGDAPPQGSKKKKTEEDIVRVDANLGLTSDCVDERPLQSCIHHGHSSTAGVIDPQTGLCTSAMQTATSTPTSASVCSDPDCETHNFINDDDMYGGCYEDRGGANGNRERESKHCDCCYCEFFGHGGPAPTSRNYTENRDRLRLKLRDRKQRPKDQSPSSADHNHECDQFDHLDLEDDRTLEDLVSFINGEKQREKTNAKTKAAKRHRQKQRKAEEKAKHEELEEVMRGLAREEEKRKEEAAAAAAAKLLQQQRERDKAEKQQQLKQQMKNGKPEAPSLKIKKKGTREGVLQHQQQQQQGRQEQGPKQQQQLQKSSQSNGTCLASVQLKQSTSRQSPTKQVAAHQATKQQQQQAVPIETPNVSTKATANKEKNKQQGLKQDNVSTTAQLNKQSEKNQKNQQQHQTKPKQTVEQDSNCTNGLQQNGKLTIKKGTESSGDSNVPSKKTAAPTAANTTKGTKKQQPESQHENHHKQKEDLKHRADPKEKNQVMGKTPTQCQQQPTKKVDGQSSFPKQDKVAINGIGGDSQTLSNGSLKKKKKKRSSSENPNASIDEIFMPKENADMAEMDETEREIEDFKRFCMAATPAPNKEKVVFSIKELTLKKGSVAAH